MGLRLKGKNESAKLGSSGSGSITLSAEDLTSGAAPDVLDKPAIILHIGDFMSQDGEVKVDEKRLANAVKVNNAKIQKLAEYYGGEDKIPNGKFPRIMEDHEAENASRATIGRMRGPYELVKADIPELGLTGIPAIKAHVLRFLGAANTSRVLDGRIHYLSLGLDEKNDDEFNEISSVGEPAAPGAALMSKGKTNTKALAAATSKGAHMATKLKKKASSTKRLAKLIEARTNIKHLAAELKLSHTKLVGMNDTIKLAAKNLKIDGELRSIVRMGKMTPAEYKNIKRDDLVKLDAASLKICLAAYSGREKPVIDPRQMGSTDSVEGGQLSKELGKKRLKHETRKDLKRMGVKLSKEAEAEMKEDEKMSAGAEEGGKSLGSEEDGNDKQAHLAEYAAHMEKLGKHLEAGNLKEAKEAFDLAHKMSKGSKNLSLGDGAGSEDYDSKLSEMQEQLDSVSTVVSKLAAEVDKVSGLAEGDELAAGEEEEEGEESEEEKAAKEAAAAAAKKKAAQE